MSIFLKTEKILGNKWFTYIALLIGFACWVLSIPFVGVCIEAIFFCGILVFCKDIKNIFVILFYAPFFIDDIARNADWNIYLICISAVVVCLIYYIVKMLLFAKTEKNLSGHAVLKKGKLFWGFVAIGIVAFLGGIPANFDIITSLIMSGFVFVAYGFYFFSINFLKKLGDFLFTVFIDGGILIVAEITVIYLIRGEYEENWIASQNVNTVAIYLLLAVVACYFKGIGKKYDGLYLMLAVLFNFAMIITRCRMMLLITLPIDILLYIKMIKCSPKRKYVIICTIFSVLAVACFCLVFLNNIKEIIERMFNKSPLSGRDELWSWCWNRFVENPIFGYGFLSSVEVPAIRDTIGALILAHNTLLQWLTSTGIVGFSGAIYFYFLKYSVVFKKPNKNKTFFAISILAIAVSGMMDQAAVMDPFIFFISMVLVAVCEVSEADNVLISEY